MPSLQSSECVHSFSEVETEARMVYSRRKGCLGNTLVWGPQKVGERRDGERALMCGILSRADGVPFVMQLQYYMARTYL